MSMGGSTRMHGQLERSLRTPAILVLGFNGVIGGGIFLLPGQVAKYAGANSLLAVLTAGILSLLIGLSYSELGSMFTETGGSYVYTRRALGAEVGFSVGWMAWLNYVVGWAVLSNGLVVYLGTLLPWMVHFKALLIVLVVGGLCWLNMTGVGRAALSIQILTVAKLLPLIMVIFYGLFLTTQPSIPIVGTLHPGFVKAVLLLIFAYGGFEMAAVPAGEMVNPRRTVAVAITGTLVGVTAFYMLVQYAAQRIDPNLANASAPLATVGRLMFAGGLTVMTVGALLSILGTKSGVALSSPRSLFALACDGGLPDWLGNVDERYKTPVAAIWTTGVFAMSLALSNSFSQLILLNVVARLYEYLMVGISVIVLRFREREKHRPIKLPFGITIPLLAVLFCTGLLLSESTRQLLLASLALAAGFVFHVVHRWKQRRVTVRLR